MHTIGARVRSELVSTVRRPSVYLFSAHNPPVAQSHFDHGACIACEYGKSSKTRIINWALP